MRFLLIAIMASLVAISGCTSHSKSEDPGASAAAASAAQAAALAAFKQQAKAAAGNSYTATYRAEGSSPPSTGTIEVYRTPGKTRLDIQAGGASERILVEPQGTYLCKLEKTSPCVTLAGPGEPLPSALDLQLQIRHLFTTAPDAMADGTGFVVHEAPPASSGSPAASSARPSSSCFVVVSAPSESGVDPGTYCFDDGMLTSVRFRTGSLTLTDRGPTPKDADFALPASPVPLSPSATPSS